MCHMYIEDGVKGRSWMKTEKLLHDLTYIWNRAAQLPRKQKLMATKLKLGALKMLTKGNKLLVRQARPMLEIYCISW